MEWYHATLITMAVVAGVLAWRIPEAVVTVGVGAFFYVTSAWMHLNGLPVAMIYGISSNLVMCLLLYPMPKSAGRWVDKVFSCYILMLLIDLLYVTGVIQSPYVFAVSLEVVTAYALLLIWAAGIAERAANGRRPYHMHRDFLGRFNRSLLAERKEYPKWWRHP